MPLTPADVHNVAFSKPPIGKRGYNEDEVDQFLDLVEDTLAQLQDENDELRARAEEASGGAAAATSQAPAATRSDVDENALRSKIEAELRAKFDEELNSLKRDNEKLERDLRTARTELDNEKKKAARDRQQAEADRAAAGSSQRVKDTDARATSKAAASQDVADTGAESDAQGQSHMQAAKVLGMAQEMADRLTSDAEREASTLVLSLIHI